MSDFASPAARPGAHFPLTAMAAAIALLAAPAVLHAQEAAPIESIQVSGSWLGSGLRNSVKNFPGART
ncbi:MAG: hypothetical protein ABIQ08_08540, partial [Duganella sp.]